MTKVIGLLGPAGAGKSSVAQYLVENYGAVRYSFAGPLKELAKRTLDFTDEQLYGTQAQKETIDPRYGFSCRTFLQKLGTEGCRKTFGEDFWTTQLLAKIARETPELAVIEDARFVNEAEAIRRMCVVVTDSGPTIGFVWRLESPNRETTADASHASEAEWMQAPHDIMIAPHERGLSLLFTIVDDACKLFEIPRCPTIARVL